MSPKLTSLIASVVAAIFAIFLSYFTTTPEFLTQLILGAAAFVITGLLLLFLLLLPWFRPLAAKRQRAVIWSVAASTAMVVSFLPLALFLLRR